MEHSATSLPANITAGIGNQIQDNSSCFPESNDMQFTFIPVYIMITSVLGILLNVLVLMVFCLHKKSCTTAEIYLSNMAAADLILVSFLPFRAFYILNLHDWTFGPFLCQLVSVSILMNVFCSIYFLVQVSIDRYLALVHPTSSGGIRRPVIAKLGCVLVWILGFVFSLPALIYRENINIFNKKAICILNDPTFSKASVSVFGFFLPVFIISFFTINIIKTLRNEKKEGVNTKRTDREETTLVLAVPLEFSIFWFPCQLMKTIVLLSDGNILTGGCFFLYNLKSYSQIFCHFTFLKNVLNPIVYIILGENFQKKAAELKRNPNNAPPPTTTIRLSGSVQSEDDAL